MIHGEGFVFILKSALSEKISFSAAGACDYAYDFPMSRVCPVGFPRAEVARVSACSCSDTGLNLPKSRLCRNAGALMKRNAFMGNGRRLPPYRLWLRCNPTSTKVK
jgi:hypothetical protein